MLSRFSRVRPCATLWTAAHQAPPSIGFSRQEYWSGLPFPSISMQKPEAEIRKGKSKTNRKPVYPSFVILVLNKILTVLLRVRYYFQCWRKVTCLYSRLSGFESRVPHFLTGITCVIRRNTWHSMNKTAQGGGWCLSSCLFFSLSSTWAPSLHLLLSGSSLSWWLSCPSWGF